MAVFFLLLEIYMSSFLWVVLVPALLPVILILWYVYRADKNEREPFGFVMKVLLMGAIFSIPCGFIELALEPLLKLFYSEETVQYGFLENTIGVALVEELSKYLVLMIFVWKSEDFDYSFDGIVYAATASLGFAALENIQYIISYGAEISLGRAIFAIPGHTTFGVFMGFYLSKAKKRWLENRGCGFQKLLTIAVPTLIHGIYDFLLSEQAQAADLAWIFIFFVIFIDIFSLKIIKKQSKKDKPLGVIKKIKNTEEAESTSNNTEA